MAGISLDSASLEEQMRLQARLLQACRVGLLLIQPDQSITWANERACTELGYAIDIMTTTMFLRDLLPEEMLRWHDPMVDEWFANPRVLTLNRSAGNVSEEFLMRRRDGSHVPVGIQISPVPIFEHNQMISFRGRPSVTTVAFLEITFMRDFSVYEQFRSLSNHLNNFAGGGSEQRTRGDGPTTRHEERAGAEEAAGNPGCGRPANAGPMGEASPNNQEAERRGKNSDKSCPRGSADSRKSEPSSGFSTEGLDN